MCSEELMGCNSTCGRLTGPAHAPVQRNLIHVVRLQAQIGAVQRALDAARLRDVVGAQPRRPLAPCQDVVDHAQAWLRSFRFGQKDACTSCRA